MYQKIFYELSHFLSPEGVQRLRKKGDSGSGSLVEAEARAVWKSPEGQLFVIAPHDNGEGQILFLYDERGSSIKPYRDCECFSD